MAIKSVEARVANYSDVQLGMISRGLAWQIFKTDRGLDRRDLTAHEMVFSSFIQVLRQEGRLPNEEDITKEDVMAASRAARSLHRIEVLGSLRYRLENEKSRRIRAMLR